MYIPTQYICGPSYKGWCVSMILKLRCSKWQTMITWIRVFLVISHSKIISSKYLKAKLIPSCRSAWYTAVFAPKMNCLVVKIYYTSSISAMNFYILPTLQNRISVSFWYWEVVNLMIYIEVSKRSYQMKDCSIKCSQKEKSFFFNSNSNEDCLIWDHIYNALNIRLRQTTYLSG